MTRIGLLGAKGRMGRAIAFLVDEAAEAILAGGADRGDDAAALAAKSDVLIDFSTPDALFAHLDAAVGAGVPIVIGTTGLDEAHEAAIARAAEKVAVLQAANMSLGVNLLAHLVRDAAARLGAGWDIEIAELHHRDKRDAPSGTALALGRAAAEGRGVDPEEIGYASLRAGTAAGDHLVLFAGDGERLELGHRAESREIFARGAILAALWLHGKPPGRYAMKDVLGL